MRTNFHTHTTFCDGKNTVEEMVLAAIDRGFSAIGFSGHAPVASSNYAMRDTGAYIAEIKRVKTRYADRIQIYLGIEEESRAPVNRADFEYIIGSSHKFCVDGKHYNIDSNLEGFLQCLELFHGDALLMAETYYRELCEYILRRKPDIVGHFDLITKFEEVSTPIFFENEKYHQIAEKYLTEAIGSGCVFEVNTGAISRGYRTTPYPHERLLHVLKKQGARVILTSDCHSADTLDCHFEESERMLREIGFEHLYTIYNGEWVKYAI